MPPRKRRRSQAFPESNQENCEVITEHLSDSDKERDVWDSFREEHFEAVDQMPLTLHRHYALMKELDQQAHSYIAQLLPTLQRYISRRREMAAQTRISTSPLATSNSNVFLNMNIHFGTERLSTPRSLSTPNGLTSVLEPVSVGHSTSGTLGIASSTTTQTPDLSDHVECRKPTQPMLSHIALLADELFRASEEKVNLVQAAFDSVDRHVRILDQAIVEQEKSLSLSARPGHLTPSLPEVIVPRRGPASRASSSSADEDDDDLVFGGALEYGDPTSDGFTSARPRGSRKRGHLCDREQLFCYCRRTSFGKMVACDNKKCETEWFHIDCLGLREVPEGSWYCSDKCQSTTRRRRK